ncbi:MAG TPA: ATP-grasp domain-containing protein [Mycobacteriales bacterium]|nr:ATP-grasp domain-containing protein [Mycobacteriales bacterium]
MNVLLIAPGFPAEMPYFTRGLASTGARVIGLGDQPAAGLPEMARRHLSDYLQVGSFADEQGIVAEVLRHAQRLQISQVECLWEPMMVLAARIREALGLPGMTVEQTVPFRDKEVMKQVLDRAGIRTPRHVSTRSADGVRTAAEHIGYPLIVKPIAGAGSANTYRIADRAELEAALPRLRNVAEVSVEEFIDAEEFTFDTICAGGQVLYYNICWYRPRPLITRQLEWVSPCTVALRDPDVPYLAGGKAMGFDVLRAMDFRDGFTHMEWYLKPDGEVVFGEIGARPPGARTVDVMNFSVDLDLFAGWGHAVVHGRLPQPVERKYNAASVFKRAQGKGRIQHIEGLGRLMAEYGEHVVALDLLPLGTPRRDWMQTLISDGMVMIRHPELSMTLEMADRFATELQMYAG